MKYFYKYYTKIGHLYIGEENKYITNISTDKTALGKDYIFESTPTTYKAFTEIEEYLYGKRTKFDLPIKFKGSSFQERVWKTLLKIPYGHKKSYKEIAETINNPKAFRAVGSANGKNPILIVIPCHRVLNHNGGLGGFSSGLHIKKKLLDIEGIDYYE